MIVKEFIEDLLKATSAKIVITIIAGFVITYVVTDHPSQKNEEVPNNEKNQQRDLNTKKTRKPSSIRNPTKQKKPEFYKETAKITSYDQSNFVAPADSRPSEENNSENIKSSSSYQSLSPSSPTPHPLARQELENNNAKSNKSTQTSALAKQIFLGSGTQLSDDKKAEEKETPTAASSLSSPKLSPPIIITNSCSTNITGGAFGNPIGVTLACLYPSTIKYCLSKDTTCCDPESGGSSYENQVVIGPQNGNYCLSYYGDSDTGGDSVIYQQNYIINSTFPNLTVGNQKNFYQTTELNGISFISSLDFGKSNFSVGQINLKSHDPSSSGLNYNCDEIISNYVTLSSPTPTEVLSLFDVALASVNSQIEIPLRLDHLAYGDNFIISYIENNNFVTPLYSCSTTVINLDDFEYFQADDSQSVAGDNSVREFEGEFSSYGFFEEESVVSRSPAGVNTEEQTGQNLKSGMYGMIY